MMQTALSLAGRKVLVTGGSSGIGNSIARGLFEVGAEVTILSRRSPSTWERPMPTGWPAARCWLEGDFSKLEETLARLRRWLEANEQRLDVLVHSAVAYGSSSRRPLLEMQIEEWDRVFDVGPRAYFGVLSAVLPALLRRPSSLVLSISSEVAYHAGPGRVDYAASKAASRSFSMSIAEELKETGVAVVDLAPEGMVNTPGIRRRRKQQADLSDYSSPDSFIGPARRLVMTMGQGQSGECFIVTSEGEMAALGAKPLLSQTRTEDVKTSSAGKPGARRKASPVLEGYQGLVPDDVLEDIERLSADLKGLRVVHYNTTAKGGGVSILLRALLSAVAPLGIDHQREIVPLDEECCRFMAKLTDLLQGGGPGEISPDEQRAFVDGVAAALQRRSGARGDVYWVHDAQLVPMASLLPWLRPVAWVSHLDTAKPNADAESFVRSFLGDYDLCVNNTPWSAFNARAARPLETLTLGIDACGAQNRPMARDVGTALLQRCGIDTTRPLVAQVSRFGRWKNPWQAVDVYRELKRLVPGVQLALVGALEATDDFAAAPVLAEVRKHAGDDVNIHLLSDPSRIGLDEVNAFQRYADVILQRSSHEGFGFSVTEAMWKQNPVIGTTATGVRYQIDHGRTGFIADDSTACAEHAAQLLSDRELHRRMGEAAREHVRCNFLLPMMVRSYLVFVQRLGRAR